MATIFSRIVAGEIPAYKIAEDERFFSFLDINPLVKGHTLVIPKQETDYLFDLDDNTLADMMVFAKRVAKALKSVVPCKRIGIAVLGLEVPHAHIHSEGDINFSKSRVKLSKEEFAQLAERIAKDMV